MTQPPYTPPEQPQAPQMPQAPYPPQAPGQLPYTAPTAAAMAAPPAPKKRKTGLIVAIVIIAVAVLATASYFGVKLVVGNKLTPYCQTALTVSSQIEDLSNQLTTASTDGDMDEMSRIIGEMIDLFDQLRDASPPDTVAPSLDTVYDYLTHIKEFIDSKDMVGYLEYTSQHDPMEFASAASTVDTATVEYCNG